MPTAAHVVDVSPHVAVPTDSRRPHVQIQTADTVRGLIAAADGVQIGSAEDLAVRLRILGLLLSPAARTIDRAIASHHIASSLPTTEREIVGNTIFTAFLNHLLGIDGAAMIPLADLARDPTGWADAYARGCLNYGMTEVRRARTRSTPVDYGELPPERLAARHTAPSAEAQLVVLRDEAALEAVEELLADTSRSAYDRDVLAARELVRLRGVPAPVVVSAHRRWLARLVERGDAAELLRESLTAARDLNGGDPTWSRAHVDDRLLDLWMDYSYEQARTLLAATDQTLVAIARGYIVYPPQPTEAERIAVRKIAKAATSTKGWFTIVMQLESAWVAEHFSSRSQGNHVDRRSDSEAEAERAAAARHWPAAVQRALEHPGAPAGAARDADGIVAWLNTILALVRARRAR